jgi:hypothetical protein
MQLYRAWGRPAAHGENCLTDFCQYRRGYNFVSGSAAHRPERLQPSLLTSLSLSSGTPRSVPSRSALEASPLRGWHTPEGVHIGLGLAAAKRLYPAGLECGLYYGRTTEICTFRTPPLNAGPKRRQVFVEQFSGYVKEPTVDQVAAYLKGDEGHCELAGGGGFGSNPNVVNRVGVVATCWGRLSSASFQLLGQHRLVEVDQAEARPTQALDPDGEDFLQKIPESNAFDVAGRRAGPAGYSFDVQCSAPIDPPVMCFPGRGTNTGAAQLFWPADTFEEWTISLGQATFAPAMRLNKDDPKAGPPLKFTAHFVGLPDYTITIREAGTWR